MEYNASESIADPSNIVVVPRLVATPWNKSCKAWAICEVGAWRVVICARESPNVLAHVVPHGYKNVPAGLPACLPAVRMAGRQWISLDIVKLLRTRLAEQISTNVFGLVLNASFHIACD